MNLSKGQFGASSVVAKQVHPFPTGRDPQDEQNLVAEQRCHQTCWVRERNICQRGDGVSWLTDNGFSLLEFAAFCGPRPSADVDRDTAGMVVLMATNKKGKETRTTKQRWAEFQTGCWLQPFSLFDDSNQFSSCQDSAELGEESLQRGQEGWMKKSREKKTCFGEMHLRVWSAWLDLSQKHFEVDRTAWV